VETPAELEIAWNTALELGVKRFAEGDDRRQGICYPNTWIERYGVDAKLPALRES
jgi:hypothetical protein